MTSEIGLQQLSNKKHGPLGYTLVELLLVVLIVAILSGVSVPMFARSYQGAQLRLAARTVVTAHRHARATAVLQQISTALLLYSDLGRIEVIRFEDRAREQEAQAFLEGSTSSETGLDISLVPEIVRVFGDDVSVEAVETKTEFSQVEEGVYWIYYYPNGMSDGFAIQMADKGGRRVRIVSDAVGGSIRVIDQ